MLASEHHGTHREVMSGIATDFGVRREEYFWAWHGKCDFLEILFLWRDLLF